MKQTTEMGTYFLCILLASSLHVTYADILSESTLNATKNDDLLIKKPVTSRARAEIGQFPEAVAVLLDGLFMCSGTILSPDTILTAAICVAMIPDLQVNDVTVVTNSVNRRDGHVVNASAVITHPQFRYYPQQLVLEHDLALIRLATPLTLDGTNASAIHLPEISVASDLWANQSAIVVGWGVTEDGRRDTSLQFMNVTITYQENCAVYYRALTPAPYQLDAGQMCSTPSVDLCIGESGAGLRVIDQDNKPLLVGVAGPAVGCPAPKRPEIYTRVAHYLTWIRENMNKQNNASQI